MSFWEGFSKESTSIPAINPPKPMKPPKPVQNVSPPNHGKVKDPIRVEQNTSGVNTVKTKMDFGKFGFWRGFLKRSASSGATYDRELAAPIKPSQETIDHIGPWQVKDPDKDPEEKEEVAVISGDANMEGEADQAEIQRGEPTPRDGYRGYPGGI